MPPNPLPTFVILPFQERLGKEADVLRSAAE
jgi:hypothetical protein